MKDAVASADGGVSASTVTLGRLALGGSDGAPEVVLSNVVWTASRAMGKPGTAPFAIGSVTVAGQPLPIPGGTSPADVLKTVNDALARWASAPDASASRLVVNALLAAGTTWGAGGWNSAARRPAYLGGATPSAPKRYPFPSLPEGAGAAPWRFRRPHETRTHSSGVMHWAAYWSAPRRGPTIR